MLLINRSLRHYQELLRGRETEPHPIDVAVGEIPEVARLDRRARKLAEEVKRRLPSAEHSRWIRYQDLLLRRLLVRQELFFNAAFELGRLAGRAESDQSTTAAGGARVASATKDFSATIRNLASTVPLDRPRIVAVLLETARSLALDLPLSRSRSSG